LQIKILGQEKVTDIAAYIALIYKYTVGAAAVLAVVMILWGGIVYLTAGGLPDKINQAKEYISNALIGLVLLYTSYLLLQTLNPDLVKLRMPRVYMLRPLTLGAIFCEDMAPEEALGEYSGGFALAEKDKPIPTKFDLGPGDLDCNKEYYWQKGGKQKCWGKRCPTKEGKKQVCLPLKNPTPENQFECKEGQVAVNFTYRNNRFVDKAIFMADCYPQIDEVLEREDPDNPKTSSGSQTFIFPVDLNYKAMWACPKYERGIKTGNRPPRGFYFIIEVHDNDFLGKDDIYDLGKSNDKPISRSFNQPFDQNDLLQSTDFFTSRYYTIGDNFPED